MAATSGSAIDPLQPKIFPHVWGKYGEAGMGVLPCEWSFTAKVSSPLGEVGEHREPGEGRHISPVIQLAIAPTNPEREKKGSKLKAELARRERRSQEK